MATKHGSRRWLNEHFNDPYVKQAQQEGYRSRAVYKLLELQERDRLFKPGMVVVDLGAAPGGWSQVVAKLIKPGKLVAVDILPMDPLEGVIFIQGDFTAESVVQSLVDSLEGALPDWVISDMAPNLSGNVSVDIPRSIYLAELALQFAADHLKPEGGFLIKVFQGAGFDTLLTDIKRKFTKTMIKKPKASRGRSREVYILARGKRHT